MAALNAWCTIIALCAFIATHNFFYAIGASAGTVATMFIVLHIIETMINNAITNKSAKTEIKTKEPEKK
jgi:hypothetical protein